MQRLKLMKSKYSRDGHQTPTFRWPPLWWHWKLPGVETWPMAGRNHKGQKTLRRYNKASPQANGKCLQWNLEMWHWHKNPMVRYKCTPRWRRFDLMARPQSFSSIALCSVSSLATWSGRFTIFLSPICLLIGTRRSRWRYTYTQILDLQTEIKTYTHTMPVQWAAVT